MKRLRCQHEAIALCNSVLAYVGVTHPVRTLSEVLALGANGSLCVAATEVLLGQTLQRVHRSPSNAIQRSANCAAVLSALESALSGVSLDHILPSAVVAGDVLHITSMLELIAELVKMPEVLSRQLISNSRPSATATPGLVGRCTSARSSPATAAVKQQCEPLEVPCTATQAQPDQQHAEKQSQQAAVRRKRQSGAAAVVARSSSRPSTSSNTSPTSLSTHDQHPSVTPEVAHGIMASAQPTGAAAGTSAAANIRSVSPMHLAADANRSTAAATSWHNVEVNALQVLNQLQTANREIKVSQAASVGVQQVRELSCRFPDDNSPQVVHKQQPTVCESKQLEKQHHQRQQCEVEAAECISSHDHLGHLQSVMMHLAELHLAQHQLVEVEQQIKQNSMLLAEQQQKQHQHQEQQQQQQQSAKLTDAAEYANNHQTPSKLLGDCNRRADDVNEERSSSSTGNSDNSSGSAATAAASPDYDVQQTQSSCTAMQMQCSHGGSRNVGLLQEPDSKSNCAGSLEAYIAAEIAQCLSALDHVSCIQDMAYNSAEQQQQQLQDRGRSAETNHSSNNSNGAASADCRDSCQNRSDYKPTAEVPENSSIMSQQQQQQQQEQLPHVIVHEAGIAQITGEISREHDSSRQHDLDTSSHLDDIGRRRNPPGSRKARKHTSRPSTARIVQHSSSSSRRSEDRCLNIPQQQITAPAEWQTRSSKISDPAADFVLKGRRNQCGNDRAAAAAAVSRVSAAKITHEVARQQLLQQQVLRQQAAAVRRLQFQQQQQQNAKLKVTDGRVAQLKQQQQQCEGTQQSRTPTVAGPSAGSNAQSQSTWQSAAQKAACRLKQLSNNSKHRTASPSSSRLTSSQLCGHYMASNRSPVKLSFEPDAAAGASGTDALLQLEQLRAEYAAVLSMFEDLLVAERRGRMDAERSLVQLMRQMTIERKLRVEGKAVRP